MANKYLKGGALNPAWCMEQDAANETRRITESLEILYDLFDDDEDIDIALELGEGVTANISKNKKLKETCSTNTERDYEAIFNFLKKHSGTPEDLELAKEIVGLK